MSCTDVDLEGGEFEHCPPSVDTCDDEKDQDFRWADVEDDVISAWIVTDM